MNNLRYESINSTMKMHVNGILGGERERESKSDDIIKCITKNMMLVSRPSSMMQMGKR